MGSLPGLDSIRRLLDRLDNPQEKLSVIHVAGTNGKGSVCSYLQSALSLAGYRVGVYTSPAVFDERERFAVDGLWISREEYWRQAERIRRACLDIRAKGFPQPTIFEVDTALAYLYFLDQHCDLVITETGMGGALDATNAVEKPLCCVFASVGMDHMQMLGSTLEEIAAQKAGIIKEGRPVVSTWQDPAVRSVLTDVAKKKGAEIRFADPGEITEISGGRIRCGDYELSPALEGTFQIQNSGLALHTLLLLRDEGYAISDEVMLEGIHRAYWPGRMERILSCPKVYLDGAHNLPAALQLKRTIQKKFTNQRITYIIGVLADKDYDGMLRELLPLAEDVITVTPQNPRALDAKSLAKAAKRWHDHVTAASDFCEAAGLALRGGSDVILAFGSLSYLRDIKSAILKRNEEMSHV